LHKTDSLIITLIGKVNAGKTSLFFKLLNINECRSKISPIAGWTKEIELLPVYKDTFLADTPGLDDIETAVSDKTIDFIGSTDIFAHVINAAEGVTGTVKNCSAELFKTGRPVVTIINKIDALSGKNELEELKADIFEKLTHVKNCGRLYFTCGSSGEGIDLLSEGFLDILKGGEKILKLARFLRVNRPEIEKALYAQSLSFVKYAAARAFAISASPVPFSETVPLMMNQYYMIIKIAGVYGEEMTYKNIRAVLGSLGAAIVGTSLASTFFYGVKSAVAAGVTYALGRVMITWIASGKTIPIDKLKEMFDKYKSEYKKENIDIKAQNGIKYIQYSKEAELYSNDNQKNI
jgi:small GTP-binding protein